MDSIEIKVFAGEVVEFVANGNWLGASWPQYACSINLFLEGNEAIDAVIEEAERINPNLWFDSQRNFERESEEFAAKERAIDALMDTAIEEGNLDLADLCYRALRGDERAWEECEHLIKQ